MYENLAEAYEAAGNKELAIKNYQRSLQLSPDNKKAEDHLKKLLPAPSN
ncbi:tetratricopeptide repeat protein [Pseudoflavitalea sp. X16]|nr:tetratricopeptide repeat protein [Paraflavitalea devenefica]